MKKKKSKLFVVHHGTFPFSVLVSIGAELPDVINFIEKRKGYKLSEKEKEKLVMSGIGRAVMLEDGPSVLQIKGDQKGKDLHGVLAHEIFHCVEFLFDHVGISHNVEKSGEAYAYQIQHLTEQIYENM